MVFENAAYKCLPNCNWSDLKFGMGNLCLPSLRFERYLSHRWASDDGRNLSQNLALLNICSWHDKLVILMILTTVTIVI